MPAIFVSEPDGSIGDEGFQLLSGGAAEGVSAVEDGGGVEAFAEVAGDCLGVTEDFFGAAGNEDLSVADDVGTVGDGECFAFAVIGKEDRDAAIAKSADDVLDTVNGDGVDAGEGFVKQDDFRVAGESAGNFKAATFTAGERAGTLGAFFVEAEFAEELAGAFDGLLAGEFLEFEDSEKVLFDGEFGEYRRILGQVTKSVPGALVHGPAGDVDAFEEDAAFGGGNQPAGHAKAGALTSAVRPQQSDDLTLVHGETHPIDSSFAGVVLNKVFTGE